MFGVFSTGDLIAIAVAMLANIATVGVTVFVQLREDRRARSIEAWHRSTEKARRVESTFSGILLGAGQIQGMTGIWNWKRDDWRGESEREDLYRILRRVQDDLQAADVSLTLEGIKAPIALINEMYGEFTAFRRGLSRLGTSSEPQDLSEQMQAHAKSIGDIRERLVADLPDILKSIEPEHPALETHGFRWPWTR